jgi:hypothetical protein
METLARDERRLSVIRDGTSQLPEGKKQVSIVPLKFEVPDYTGNAYKIRTQQDCS